MKVHEKIKVMRQYKRLTQETMAELLGYSVHGYAKLERGEVSLTIDKLERIADVFDISLQDLLGFNESSAIRIAEGIAQSSAPPLAESEFNLEPSLKSGSSSKRVDEDKNDTQAASGGFSALDMEEKLRLLYAERENELLRQQMEMLKDMIYLLKKREEY
jgi:transcriptional regulator with XRE-family HTH domain